MSDDLSDDQPGDLTAGRVPGSPDDQAAGRLRRLGAAASMPVAREIIKAIDAKAKVDLKRAVPAVLVALLSFGFGDRLGGFNRPDAASFDLFGTRLDLSRSHVTLLVFGLTVLFALAGFVATRSIGRELARVSQAHGAIATGSVVRLICFVVGYSIVGLGVLTLLRVNLGNLLFGGAITGVIVGIAAQQTLGNFFAGLVLLFARPYVPGQRVKIRSGGLGGPFEGVILGAGLIYTTIETDEGIISMPNSGLLGAAIGPADPRATS
ncbi:MAG TPA: mechanosensitive ion channel family protein [Jatrophihabitantaceae bacterium]|nr:mechanosensitive ion channel family protein [Jatrophihabitantaceae bacterium]